MRKIMNARKYFSVSRVKMAILSAFFLAWNSVPAAAGPIVTAVATVITEIGISEAAATILAQAIVAVTVSVGLARPSRPIAFKERKVP
jgi:phosphate/sulfate permease